MAAKKKVSPSAAHAPQEIPLGPESPLVLTALREDNPRDFLAALGLLRLLDSLWPQSIVSLAWNTDGHPVIHARVALPDDWPVQLVAELAALNRVSPHPFVHHKVIKTNHRLFRASVEPALKMRAGGYSLSKLPAMLYAAYASQVHDTEKDECSPTAFSFSNGQGGKELLRDIAELIVAELSPANLIADLTGDLAALRDAKSFRWHPAEFRAAAYRSHNPGGGVKGDVTLDYPVANIMAFFGLTSYPVVDRSQAEQTLGFSRRYFDHKSFDCFTWPIWSYPMGVDIMSTLLWLPQLHSNDLRLHELRAHGCIHLWRSRRFSSDKSLYFSPAEQLL